jgi:hypothetical protein
MPSTSARDCATPVSQSGSPRHPTLEGEAAMIERIETGAAAKAWTSTLLSVARPRGTCTPD